METFALRPLTLFFRNDRWLSMLILGIALFTICSADSYRRLSLLDSLALVRSAGYGGLAGGDVRACLLMSKSALALDNELP